MYLTTFWSYLGGIWTVVFMAAPIIFMLTGVSPVSAYTTGFFAHAIPFLIANELAFMMGTWGVASHKAKATYLASFPVAIRALWTVLRRQEISFHVTPKERQSGNFLRLVRPQLALIALTLISFAWALASYVQGDPRFTLGGLIANGFWSLNNILMMSVIVRAALWKPDQTQSESA